MELELNGVREITKEDFVIESIDVDGEEYVHSLQLVCKPEEIFGAEVKGQRIEISAWSTLQLDVLKEELWVYIFPNGSDSSTEYTIGVYQLSEKECRIILSAIQYMEGKNLLTEHNFGVSRVYFGNENRNKIGICLVDVDLKSILKVPFPEDGPVTLETNVLVEFLEPELDKPVFTVEGDLEVRAYEGFQSVSYSFFLAEVEREEILKKVDTPAFRKEVQKIYEFRKLPEIYSSREITADDFKVSEDVVDPLNISRSKDGRRCVYFDLTDKVASDLFCLEVQDCFLQCIVTEDFRAMEDFISVSVCSSEFEDEKQRVARYNLTQEEKIIVFSAAVKAEQARLSRSLDGYINSERE